MFGGKGKGKKGAIWGKGKGFGFDGYNGYCNPTGGFGGKLGSQAWNPAESYFRGTDGFQNVSGTNGRLHNKVWVFCKNQPDGCPGKCFLGPKVPLKCNFCNQQNPWIVPKNFKHLLREQRSSSPAAASDRSGNSNVSSLHQSQELLKFCEEREFDQEVTKDIFKKMNLPVLKPVKSVSSVDASLAALKAAQGIVSKLSNDLIGKHSKRNKLQEDLLNIEADMISFEAQIENAN
jgi:hypothetical protein